MEITTGHVANAPQAPSYVERVAAIRSHIRNPELAALADLIVTVSEEILDRLPLKVVTNAQKEALVAHATLWIENHPDSGDLRFLNDLVDQWHNKGRLSAKQIDHLVRLTEYEG